MRSGTGRRSRVLCIGPAVWAPSAVLGRSVPWEVEPPVPLTAMPVPFPVVSCPTLAPPPVVPLVPGLLSWLLPLPAYQPHVHLSTGALPKRLIALSP